MKKIKLQANYGKKVKVSGSGNFVKKEGKLISINHEKEFNYSDLYNKIISFSKD